MPKMGFVSSNIGFLFLTFVEIQNEITSTVFHPDTLGTRVTSVLSIVLRPTLQLRKPCPHWRCEKKNVGQVLVLRGGSGDVMPESYQMSDFGYPEFRPQEFCVPTGWSQTCSDLFLVLDSVVNQRNLSESDNARLSAILSLLPQNDTTAQLITRARTMEQRHQRQAITPPPAERSAAQPTSRQGR
jgi:hypothetical protein